MGQQISESTPRSTKRKLGFAKPLSIPSLLSLEQLIPGYLPQEILVFIFQNLDVKSFYCCAFSCKSWLEAALISYQNQYLTRYLPPPDLDRIINWKALYNFQKKTEDNIVKGRYWAESYASNYYIGDEIVYSASYYNDQIICNVATSKETRLGNISKYDMEGYIIDLNTMELKSCDRYSQEFANGYIIEGDTKTKWWFTDAVSLNVYDATGKTFLRKIERHEKESSWGSYYIAKPNLDGSDEVLTHEKSSLIQGKDLLKTKKFNIEIFALETGATIYRQKVTAMDILAYYGSFIFLLTKKGVEVYDLDQQQVRLILGSDYNTLIKINDDKLAVVEKTLIRLYDLRSFAELNSITIELDEMERIFAVNFDRWKLVIGIMIPEKHGRFDIYALDSKKLLQRLINTSDHSDDNLIYLPSNGKILTDCRNLTVYDFNHPNSRRKIKLKYFDIDQQWHEFTVRSQELTKFCEEKLGQLSQICHRTLFSTADETRRATLIFNLKDAKPCNALKEQLKTLYYHEEQIRNTFQLISNDKKWTNERFGGCFEIIIVTLNDTSHMDSQKVAELKQGFRGEVLLAEDAGYAQAVGGMFNKMFTDRKPPIICRPLGASDVSKAVKFAAEQHLKVVPRGGGHGGSGLASTDDGLLLDMSLMRGITFDRETGFATVQAGCRLSDLDYELMPHQRAIPCGLVGLTGIAGLSLHGGIGFLTRQHGLTAESIVQVEIVIASGEILIANEKQNREIFWAVRGAGSNIGVITTFLFKTYEVPQSVYGGLVVQPAVDLIEYHNKWAKKLVEDSNYECTNFHMAPPVGPPMGLACRMAVHFGPRDIAEQELEALVSTAPKAMFGYSHQPFNMANQSATEFFKGAPPTRQYWKSAHFKEWSNDLSVAVNDIFTEIRNSKFGPFSLLLTEYWDPTKNAATRDLPITLNRAVFVIATIIGWQDPALDEEGKAFARQIEEKLDKLGNLKDFAYFNYSPEDNSEIAIGSANINKVLAIKQKYDPNNMFANGNLKKRK